MVAPKNTQPPVHIKKSVFIGYILGATPRAH